MEDISSSCHLCRAKNILKHSSHQGHCIFDYMFCLISSVCCSLAGGPSKHGPIDSTDNCFPRAINALNFRSTECPHSCNVMTVFLGQSISTGPVKWTMCCGLHDFVFNISSINILYRNRAFYFITVHTITIETLFISK